MKIYTVLIGYWDDIEYRKLAHFTSKVDAFVYAGEWGFRMDKRDMSSGIPPCLYYGATQQPSGGMWCHIIGPVEVDLEFKDGEA